MTELKVGSRVWVFDYNHRVYPERKAGEGYSHGGPIYRGFFVETVIEGETSRSWIIRRYGTKIDKKTLKGIYTSEEEVDRACFVHEARMELPDKVRACADYGILQKIAALLAPAAPTEEA